MDPLLIQVVTAVIATLCGVIVVLWKEQRKWQTRWLNEHNKRLEDLKEHGRTSELFLRALETQRKKNSG